MPTTDSTDTVEPGSRWRLDWESGATLVGSLVVLVPTAVILCVLYADASAVGAELKRIRAAGEPTSGDEIAEYYRTPDLDADCTGIYLGAFATLADETGKARQIQMLRISEEEKPIPAAGEPWEDLAAVQKLLAEYDETLGSLHEAATRGGQARYPTNFEQGFNMGFNLPQDHARAGSQRAGKLLSLEAHVKAHEGDSHGVVKSIQAQIALARSFEHEPLFIAQLYRVAILDMTCDLLTRMLPSVEFADDDLKELQQDLRAIPHRKPLRNAMLGHRIFCIMFHQDPATALEVKLTAQAIVARVLPSLPSKNASLALYLKLMAQAIAATEKPYPEILPAAQALEQELKAAARASTIIGALYTLTATVIAPMFRSGVSRLLRSVARTRATDAAIAAELYRREHGDWPTELAELSPKLLPEIPEDPLDGQPLRFLRKDDKLMIYSVAENLIDDHGETGGRRQLDWVVIVDRSSGGEKR